MHPQGWDLADAVSRLELAGCVAADEEAQELVTGARDRAELEDWITRREVGEPLAWITGTMQFCDLELAIVSGVYVPRRQSEDLARRAAGFVSPGGRALDLCTGAGAIGAAVQALCPGAAVVGVDVDPLAASCARRNGVVSLVGDLVEPFGTGAVFDLVSVVAPYVPTGELRLLPADVLRYEPPVALDGGPDGLAVLRRILEAAPRVLRPGGWLVAEVGGDQDVLIAPDLEAAGFVEVKAWADEEGDLRGFAARLR